MRTFIPTTALVALMSTGSAANIVKFVNHCPYNIYSWTVGPAASGFDGEDNEAVTIPANAVAVQDMLQDNTVGGGIAFKIRDVPQYRVAPAGIIEVEYNLKPSSNSLSYGISTTNCNHGTDSEDPSFCPLMGGGMKVHVEKADQSSCGVAQCGPDGCDNNFTGLCGAQNDLSIEFCTERVGPRTYDAISEPVSSSERGHTGFTSSNGVCGIRSPDGATCFGFAHGNCCSSYGWCGYSEAHCGQGCQQEYGDCFVQSPSHEKPSTPTYVYPSWSEPSSHSIKPTFSYYQSETTYSTPVYYPSAPVYYPSANTHTQVYSHVEYTWPSYEEPSSSYHEPSTKATPAYNTPTHGYHEPSASYWKPSHEYSRPTHSYEKPPNDYNNPPSSYHYPTPVYSDPPYGYHPPPPSTPSCPPPSHKTVYKTHTRIHTHTHTKTYVSKTTTTLTNKTCENQYHAPSSSSAGYPTPESWAYHTPTTGYDPAPSYHSAPSYGTAASYDAAPSYHPVPSYKPWLSYTPAPSYDPVPSYEPAPTYDPASTYHPAPTYTPAPSYHDPSNSIYDPHPTPPHTSVYDPDPVYPTHPVYPPDYTHPVYPPDDTHSSDFHYTPSSSWHYTPISIPRPIYTSPTGDLPLASSSWIDATTLEFSTISLSEAVAVETERV